MPISPDDLRALVRETTKTSQQRQYKALEALGSVLGGLEELKTYGFFLQLEQGVQHEVEEWPKMMYHEEQGQVIVNSQEEADALGDGWSDKTHGSVPGEPMRPEREASGLGTDPRLIPAGSRSAPQGGQDQPTGKAPPLEEGPEKELVEQGKQAYRDGEEMSAAPEGPQGDAWRKGWTEEAAWAGHDGDTAGAPPKPSEDPPPAG